MATTLGQYLQRLSYALGTTETNLFTLDKRKNAVNRAISIAVQQYPIPQYVKRTTLTFVAGVATLPTDCLQPYLLYDTNDAYSEYDRVDFDKFRFQPTNTYTITYNESTKVEEINIYPTTATSLYFWYIINPPTLSADTDESRLKPWWDDAIAEKASEQLFVSSRNYNAAEAKAAVSKDLLAKAWQSERLRIEGVENMRITSIYQKHSLLGSNSSPFTSNSRLS